MNIVNLYQILKTEINNGENKKMDFKDTDFSIFFAEANCRTEMDSKNVLGLVEKKLKLSIVIINKNTFS